MQLHRPVGLADRTQIEVVRPTDQSPVEVCYQGLGIPQSLTTSRQFTNRRTDALHPFLRRNRSNIGPSRLRRVAPTKRVPEEVELPFRQSADPRLLFVHRKLQLQHHVPHGRQSLIGLATTADHEVVRVIYYERLKTLLVLQLLPTEHEP